MTQPAWLRLPAQSNRLIFAIYLQCGFFCFYLCIPQEIYEEMEALNARSAVIEDFRMYRKRIFREGELRGLLLVSGGLVDALDPPADGLQHIVRNPGRLPVKT